MCMSVQECTLLFDGVVWLISIAHYPGSVYCLNWTPWSIGLRSLLACLVTQRNAVLWLYYNHGWFKEGLHVPLTIGVLCRILPRSRIIGDNVNVTFAPQLPSNSPSNQPPLPPPPPPPPSSCVAKNSPRVRPCYLSACVRAFLRAHACITTWGSTRAHEQCTGIRHHTHTRTPRRQLLRKGGGAAQPLICRCQRLCARARVG